MVEQRLLELLQGGFVFQVGKVAIGFLIVIFMECNHVILNDTGGIIVRNINQVILACEEYDKRNHNQHGNPDQNAGKETVLFHELGSFQRDGTTGCSLATCA